MKTAWLKFDISTFWHAGTGRGAGAELDALSHRTHAGLPSLPGRTVRGLVREAMQAAAELGALGGDEGLVVRCFGTAIEDPRTDRVAAMEEARFTTSPGALVFGSARLGETPEQAEQWERWAETEEGRRQLDHLFRPFASTALDEHGVARDSTLRAIELVVPATLVARVEGPEDFDWVAPLRAAAPFLRALGSHRNRGLGRVTTTLEVA